MKGALQVLGILFLCAGILCLIGALEKPNAAELFVGAAAGGAWSGLVLLGIAAILEQLDNLRKSQDDGGAAMKAVASWLKEILAEVAEPRSKTPQVRTCFECGCPLNDAEVICPNCRTDQRPEAELADEDAMRFLDVE